mmetsp:Transcript_18984/g.60651  ORF Transcript_18984/g.60651 Transcript_18984/m.60651 type:complete len:240 (-) Transcript_18984:485-1204(-)
MVGGPIVPRRSSAGALWRRGSSPSAVVGCPRAVSAPPAVVCAPSEHWAMTVAVTSARGPPPAPAGCPTSGSGFGFAARPCGVTSDATVRGETRCHRLTGGGLTGCFCCSCASWCSSSIRAASSSAASLKRPCASSASTRTITSDERMCVTAGGCCCCSSWCGLDESGRRSHVASALSSAPRGEFGTMAGTWLAASLCFGGVADLRPSALRGTIRCWMVWITRPGVCGSSMEPRAKESVW